MAAFMRANCGGRATALNQANPELIRTDQIISRLELRLRKVIIRHYCSQGSGREKALRMGIPKSTYWQRLDEATWFVHTEYDKPETAIRESQFVHSESRTA
jgi:DNA-directed RNA polymerase specialized sigma24 family protein